MHNTFLRVFSIRWGANKKTRKEKSTETKFSRDCPGIFGEFCLCVLFLHHKERPEQKKTHKQNFATRPIPGQSHKFVYVYVFFFSWIRRGEEFRGTVFATALTLSVTDPPPPNPCSKPLSDLSTPQRFPYWCTTADAALQPGSSHRHRFINHRTTLGPS